MYYMYAAIGWNKILYIYMQFWLAITWHGMYMYLSEVFHGIELFFGAYKLLCYSSKFLLTVAL